MKGFTILIVEDDVVTSVTLTKALQTELPDVRLLRAATLFEARLILASFEIEFFVLDISLPDGNGIEFVIDVTSMNPQAGVAVITSTPLPKYRDRANSLGALNFFEKPVSPRTLAQLIRTHRAVNFPTQPGPDTSFSASLTRLNVLDVIQLKCLARATLRLTFSLNDGRFGSVDLVEGEITHAESGVAPAPPSITGSDALAQILSWRGGRIEEIKGTPPPEPNIHGTWQQLLLDAAQLADETRR
jgi:DNA-binding response OmpR family regulator